MITVALKNYTQIVSIPPVECEEIECSELGAGLEIEFVESANQAYTGGFLALRCSDLSLSYDTRFVCFGRHDRAFSDGCD